MGVTSAQHGDKDWKKTQTNTHLLKPPGAGLDGWIDNITSVPASLADYMVAPTREDCPHKRNRSKRTAKLRTR